MVHGIVHELHGGILVDSKVGAGATFQVFFPVHDTPEASSEAQETQVAQGHSERILFVDDEPALGRIARKNLEGFGYRVTVFREPTRALEALRASPKGFDLVITDLTMPGMTGIDFALEVSSLRGDLPIILCSGFTGGWTQETVRSAGIREVVEKPLSPRAMAAAVERVLNRRDGSSRESPPVPA